MASASGGQRSIQLSYGRSQYSLSAGLLSHQTNVCSSEPPPILGAAMETAGKGNATEAAILAALAARGFEVLVPFGDGHAYDLVVHLGDGCFGRVQCKTGRLTGDCISFNT